MPRYITHPRVPGIAQLLAHASRLSIALGACVLLSSRAAAQDQATVFVHGLLSTGAEWQQAASVLAQRFQLSPILPTLGFQNDFGTQATNLQNAVLGVSGIPALAHSNGGLVTRQYLKQFGSASRINRVLAIGTPHRGALLAQEVSNGDVFAYAGEVLDAITDPIQFYYFDDIDFQQAWDGGLLDLLEFAALNIGFVVQNYAVLINADIIPVPVIGNDPVIPQMFPNSAFITGLNSASNLTAESAHTIERVGAASSISPQNAFFAMISNNPGSWGAVRTVLQYYALLMYEQYSASDDPILAANAGRWLPLYFLMQDFDVQWQAFIGALRGFQGPFAIVDFSDGLVPLSSATWPGANDQRNLLLPNFSIRHADQVTDANMVNTMADVLQNEFHVPLRPVDPPPPSGGGDGGCIPPPRQLICDPGGL